MQQGGLAGIVETEEKQLGVLVEQAQGGQNIVDCYSPAAQLACSSQDTRWRWAYRDG